jgi:organic radical activating enzyme
MKNKITINRHINSNNQPIEKQPANENNGILEIHSIFRTIQGEGPFTGYPAIFIRLAGCNLQCQLCDTDYTSQRQLFEPTHIVDTIKSLCDGFNIKLIVITGGEPFRQDITELCKLLHKSKYIIQIETNGTLEIPNTLINYIKETTISNILKQELWFNIVCSPKSGKIHSSFIKNIEYIVAWKYVMAAHSIDENDGLPKLALNHSAVPRVARPIQNNNTLLTPIYLQPCDEKDPVLNQLNINACIESCLKHGYIMQLQIHKYLGVE